MRVLRGRVILVGRLAVPVRGFALVLRDAVAALVAQGQIELRAQMPLFRGLAIPFKRRYVVLGHAFSVGVARAEVVLA